MATMFSTGHVEALQQKARMLQQAQLVTPEHVRIMKWSAGKAPLLQPYMTGLKYEHPSSNLRPIPGTSMHNSLTRPNISFSNSSHIQKFLLSSLTEDDRSERRIQQFRLQNPPLIQSGSKSQSKLRELSLQQVGLGGQGGNEFDRRWQSIKPRPGETIHDANKLWCEKHVAKVKRQQKQRLDNNWRRQHRRHAHRSHRKHRIEAWDETRTKAKNSILMDSEKMTYNKSDATAYSLIGDSNLPSSFQQQDYRFFPGVR
jgi:hypothetical protein